MAEVAGDGRSEKGAWDSARIVSRKNLLFFF